MIYLCYWCFDAVSSFSTGIMSISSYGRKRWQKKPIFKYDETSVLIGSFATVIGVLNPNTWPTSQRRRIFSPHSITTKGLKTRISFIIGIAYQEKVKFT